MLTIAHIATETKPQRQKPLTAKEKLHREAVVSMAARKHHDREMAQRLFAPELAEIAMLERKLAGL